jgi:hypothetical protein
MALTSARRSPSPEPEPDQSLATAVATWVREGIISEEQGRRILARPSVAAAHPASGSPLVAEALGYLGGVVVVVGGLLVGARYWAEIGVTARLVVLGMVALGLVLAGAAVPARLGAAAHRLRAVLWTASLAASAATLVVLAVDVIDLTSQGAALLASAGTAAIGLLLHRRDSSFLLQVATGVAVLAAAGSATAVVVEPETTPGVAIWAVGAAWALLGWGEVLRPRRAVMAVGGLAMVIGSMFTIQHDAGVVATLLTAGVLVVVSLVTRDPLVLAVGALGAFQVLPVAVSRWFPDSVVAPLVLVALGLGLVALAVLVVRRQPSRGAATRAVLDRRVAVLAALAVVLAAVPVILVLGAVTT